MEPNQNPHEKENLILDLSLQFSLDIIVFVEELEQRRKFIIANQLLRSATSIGANVSEAQSGESRKDFTHKMRIAMKEVYETDYWLLLCLKSKSYPNPEKESKQLQSIKKVLSKIIKSSIDGGKKPEMVFR